MPRHIPAPVRRPRAVTAGLLAALSSALLAAPVVAPLAAQAVTKGAAPVPAPTLTRDQHAAAAVLPLPRELRESATVLQLDASGRTSVLRAGTGAMICLTDSPATPRFHVACYHKSLDPFMARGRALRTSGITSQERVDSARYAEIRAGTLEMPRQPASLYSLTGAADAYDPASNEIRGGNALHVVYIPFATGESTGLSTTPARGSAWLMNAGTPKAHMMFTPTM